MNADLQLLALDGDIEPGTKVDLYPNEPLGIGRSSRGLRLPDPLVSIHHARIEWDKKRGYVVTDLDSATGTWVDEECIQNASRPIGVGTKLRFGETSFVVQQRRRYPVWVARVMAGTLLFGVAAIALTAWLRSRPSEAPALQWREPVRQGAQSSDILAVPTDYARARSIEPSEIRIRRVSDYDYDGIDEVWLRKGDESEYVVTFNQDGSWVDLGQIPVGCHDKAMAAPGTAPDGFPALDCENVHYLFFDGKYRIARHDGVVTWVVPKKAKKKPEPAEGHEGAHEGEEEQPPPTEALVQGDMSTLRVVLKDPSRLAGFLAERGITEPVHYVVCEDAFPGLRAQALTGRGELRALSPGCLGNLKMTEDHAGKPVAIATTAWGRRALLDDLSTFYGGSPDGLFLESDKRELLDLASSPPGFMRGDVKLVFDNNAVFVDPIPKERELPAGRRPIPRDQRVEVAPPASTASVDKPGMAEIQAGGCAKLRIRTDDFLCTGLCTGDFMVVEEVGCGPAEPVLSVSYEGGTVDGSLRGLDVRAVVETGASGVLSARLGWRSTPED